MDENCNIIQRLQAAAAAVPRQAALVQPFASAHNGKKIPDATISFADLEQESAGYARFFLRQGLGPKDTALLLMPPGIAFYTLFLALARIGVSVMLVDPGVGLSHFTACTRQVRPTVFIAPPKGHLLRLRPGFSGPLRAFSLSFLPLTTRIRPLPQKTEREASTLPLSADHPALITFTSGSTGRPKAILRTHGFLLRQGDALAALMPARPGDVEFCTFPVFTLANLAQKVTTILPPAGIRRLSDTRMEDVSACMRHHKASRLLASPDFCARLCREAEDAESCFETLHTIHTGGGPVHLSLLAALAARAPKASICSLYGSTEAEPVALQEYAALRDHWHEKVRTGNGLPAGRPVGTVQLRILQDSTGQALPLLTEKAFSSLCLPPGQTGEIVVSGPLVQKGYMNPEDDAETKIRVGDTVWHRTGDAGYCDADGVVWLMGRCSAKIQTQDKTLYPLAVEAAAALLPHTRRSALVRVRDKVLLAVEGEEIPEAQRESFMKEHSALDAIVFLPHIPVDSRHNSKVLYNELRTLCEQLF